MNSKIFFLALFLSGALLAPAAAPLYRTKITSTKTFEVMAGTGLNFYPFSEQMGGTMNGKSRRRIIAADYEAGVVIKTKEPAAAIQQVLGQISKQTGLMLTTHFNSNLEQIAPATLLQAFSDTSVITLLLTPKGEDVFALACAYAIDERPEGSIDGTPAAIAQMEEAARRMTADSVATSLPEKIAANDLKPGDYFRGAQKLSLSDPTGKMQTPVMALLLKKSDNYTVGIYRNVEGTWIIIDQPVALSGTGSPHPRVKSEASETLASIRALKIDGTGGVDLYVSNGHLLQQPFSNLASRTPQFVSKWQRDTLSAQGRVVRASLELFRLTRVRRRRPRRCGR